MCNIYTVEIKSRSSDRDESIPQYHELTRINANPFYDISKALEYADGLNFDAWTICIIHHEGAGIGRMEVRAVYLLTRGAGLVTIVNFHAMLLSSIPSQMESHVS